MGLVRTGKFVHFNIPTELVLQLRDEYKISSFIETGTFIGRTAHWAAQEFHRVFTIERSEPIYKKALVNLQGISNIRLAFGDSRDLLKQVIPTLKDPAIFWIDSHWSSGETYGEGDECPLLEEIEILNSGSVQHFIFIDDARLFLETPPQPHDKSQWPLIDEVMFKLQSGPYNYVVVIIHDSIIALPQQAKKILFDYVDRVHLKAKEANA